MLIINNIEFQQEFLTFQNSDSTIRRWFIKEPDDILVVNFNLKNETDVEKALSLLKSNKINYIVGTTKEKEASDIKINFYKINSDVEVLTITLS